MRHLEVYLDVQNLLDEYFEEDPGKAASGRTVWAGIRAVF
jgi:outer membrane receptor protein involved in Fe transport